MLGCRRSPFLNMGTTLAMVQSIGMVPCFNEGWKNSVTVGVSSSMVGMISSPVALCSLSVDSNLCTAYAI